jgi:hypothetical protein
MRRDVGQKVIHIVTIESWVMMMEKERTSVEVDRDKDIPRRARTGPGIKPEGERERERARAVMRVTVHGAGSRRDRRKGEKVRRQNDRQVLPARHHSARSGLT